MTFGAPSQVTYVYDAFRAAAAAHFGTVAEVAGRARYEGVMERPSPGTITVVRPLDHVLIALRIIGG